MKTSLQHAPAMSDVEKSKMISLITDSFHKRIHPILSHPTHP